ncbi:MAG: RNA repair transcriptional activator RtcR family protein, partial [Planctomycetia bacterium]|nr:RNA repair transcriptional activator RtcR family protein [Planctomycetia bacterium]
MKPIVVYGQFGPLLDSRFNKEDEETRFKQWRPSIDILLDPKFPVARYHLLVQTNFYQDALPVIEDIKRISPHTKLVIEKLHYEDPWNFEEVYSQLFKMSEQATFCPEKEDYYVFISTGSHVSQICLFLLTESRHFPAKLLQSSPGPNNSSHGVRTIIDLDLSQYAQIATRFYQKQQSNLSHLKSGIPTRNAAFNAMMETLEHVCLHSSDPILICGESGTGKSNLAKKIYELRLETRMIKGKLVELNCATLRGDTAMSVLFGHVRGAFTGADQNRDGLLKTADQGMLFLDEIGELGMDEQAMLLKAIEEKSFLPVGANSPITSDFQLVCGTNRELKKQIRDKTFREDLFARINLWTFRLPLLAERREDIEPNLDFELNEFRNRSQRKIWFTPQARKHFLAFALSDLAVWKGNFRDLNAAIRRMGTLSQQGEINLEIVQMEIERLQEQWRQPEFEFESGPSPDAGSVMTPTPTNHQGPGKQMPLRDPLSILLGKERIAELDRF